jgi:hypothetical protein
LEGEFDLAYSPLMVRPEGKGAVMISTLDLEDQVGVDPADKVKAGTNVIHVRAFDRFGGGGIMGLAGDTHLRLKWGKTLSWYHADYREDFEYGDDAYRYYRW